MSNGQGLQEPARSLVVVGSQVQTIWQTSR